MTFANKGLEKALAVKRERIALRESVSAGAVSVSEILLDPPEVLRISRHRSRPITIADVLSWQHRWGRIRAERFCKAQGVNPTLTLFDLSPSRRRKLAEALA